MHSSLVPPEGSTRPEADPHAPTVGTVLPEHFAGCFGCGSEHPSGLHLSVAVADDFVVTSSFTVTAAHQGAPGLAHGGVMAAAMDEIVGFVIYLVRRPAVTARLETDFVRPVPLGSAVFLRSECIAVDGRKVYLQAHARLDAPDGPVALETRALFVSVGGEHFAKHAGDAAYWGSGGVGP
ncbi:MAG TPA: PaaI family thioesterase [Mycobacteriales bacterium]|nr:PaaI family thioesterase [Mycobacteriales bacterium]